MNTDTFNKLLRRNARDDFGLFIGDDIIFLKDNNIKRVITEKCLRKHACEHSKEIRSLPVLFEAKEICKNELDYLVFLLSEASRIEDNTISISDTTRFYCADYERRQQQNLSIMAYNQTIIRTKENLDELWQRIQSGNNYWKPFFSLNYRYTVNDFLIGKFGTCLDTAIIASGLLKEMGYDNYVVNLRCKTGGHSIVVIFDSDKSISNFSLMDSNYLSDCLQKFDVDSIIAENIEFRYEDISYDEKKERTLFDLARYGNYRFYSKNDRVSIPFSVIERFLETHICEN